LLLGVSIIFELVGVRVKQLGIKNTRSERPCHDEVVPGACPPRKFGNPRHVKMHPTAIWSTKLALFNCVPLYD